MSMCGWKVGEEKEGRQGWSLCFPLVSLPPQGSEQLESRRAQPQHPTLQHRLCTISSVRYQSLSLLPALSSCPPNHTAFRPFPPSLPLPLLCRRHPRLSDNLVQQDNSFPQHRGSRSERNQLQDGPPFASRRSQDQTRQLPLRTRPHTPLPPLPKQPHPHPQTCSQWCRGQRERRPTDARARATSISRPTRSSQTRPSNPLARTTTLLLLPFRLSLSVQQQ